MLLTGIDDLAMHDDRGGVPASLLPRPANWWQAGHSAAALRAALHLIAGHSD
jgi:hypothetical protein